MEWMSLPAALWARDSATIGWGIDEPQNTEFKTAIISLMKGSNQFKENMNKNLSQLKEGGTQLPSEVQANSNWRLPDAILSAP